MKYHWKTHDNISKFDADDDFFFYLQIKFIQRLRFHFIWLFFIYLFFQWDKSSLCEKRWLQKTPYTFQWLSSSVIFFLTKTFFVVMKKGKLLLIPAVKSTRIQRLALDYYRDCSGKEFKKMLACFIFVLKILKSTLS